MKRVENVKDNGVADEIIMKEYDGQKLNDIKYVINIYILGLNWLRARGQLERGVLRGIIWRRSNMGILVIRTSNQGKDPFMNKDVLIRVSQLIF